MLKENIWKMNIRKSIQSRIWMKWVSITKILKQNNGIKIITQIRSTGKVMMMDILMDTGRQKITIG